MPRWFGAMLLISLIVSGCHGSAGTAPDGDGKRQTAQKVNDMRTGSVNEALWNAAEQGDSKGILESLSAGADINATDARGRTAAMVATHANQIEVFKVLVEQGADINIRDNHSDNPLLYAGAEGLLPFVQAAVAAGADTTPTNRFGGTALIPAADRGHVEIVKELLTTSDVDINHVNNLGWTALLEAVILGDGGSRHQAIVDLLIEHGADVNLADKEGVTPLQHAKKRGYDEMIRSLEQAGAN